MCRLEEQMISEALGHEVQLSSCRLDGDSCCQFTAVQPWQDATPPDHPNKRNRVNSANRRVERAIAHTSRPSHDE
jgi:hypothetical protein